MTESTTPIGAPGESVPSPPAGPSLTADATTAPTRSWFKKKRFIIPAGVLALFIFVGAINGGGDADEEQEALSSSDRIVQTAAPVETLTPEEEAAAEAEAEAERIAQEEADAAAEAAAAAQAEADRIAAEQAAAEAAAAAGTVSQQNALRSADQYLDYTAFSRSGLIGQLEFEGYSTEDATWGVDRAGADWNEQAALSAQNYLDYTSFSRSGLIDQLIFEGFSPAEAEYGVSTTGL